MSKRAVLLGFILGVIVTTLVLSGLNFALAPAHAQTTYADPAVGCAVYVQNGNQQWLAVVHASGSIVRSPLQQ